MGRLLSLARSIEASLWSRFGRWIQEVSTTTDQAVGDVSTLQTEMNVAQADIVALQAAQSREDWKDSVAVAITSALPAFTQVGNTITFDAPGALAPQDGVAIVTTTPPQRALLAIGTAVSNGIWDVIDSGGAAAAVLERSDDANVSAEVTSAMRVPIAEGGTDHGGKVFRLATNDPIDLNVTALTFTEEQGVPDGLVDQIVTYDAPSTVTARYGTAVIAYPLDTGADDAAPLQALFTTHAGKRAVTLSSLTRAGAAADWNIATVCTVTSLSKLRFAGSVSVVSALAFGGTGSTLFPILRCIKTDGATCALSAGLPSVAGSNIIYTTEAITPGTTISLSASFMWFTFTVISCSGSADPFRVELDEPVPKVFAAGTTVTRFTSIPTAIEIDFGGATATGTGDRVWQGWFSRSCTVKGLRVDAGSLFDASLVCFDSGGRYNAIEDCDLTTGYDSYCGVELAENIRSRVVRVRVRGGCSPAAFSMHNNVDPYLEDCHALATGQDGFVFTAYNAAVVNNNLRPVLVGCKSLRAGRHGLVANYATTGLRAEAFVAEDGQCGLLDGDMEQAGVAAWDDAPNNATITKGTDTPYSGAQYLRVTAIGAVPYSRVIVLLTVGREYRMRGVARGDGTIAPSIAIGNGAWSWTGTNSTAWQVVDVTAVCLGSPDLLLGSTANPGHVDFDMLTIEDVTDIDVSGTLSVGGHGVWLLNASVDNQLTDLHTARNAGYGVRVDDSSSVVLTGWRSENDKSGCLAYASSGDVFVDGCIVTNTNKGQPGFATYAGATGKLHVRNAKISLSTDAATNAAAFRIANTAAKILITGDTEIVADRGISITGASATVQVDGLIRMVSVAEPVVLAGGATQAQCNVGTVTSDGVNPTVWTVGQIGANSVVRLYGPTGVVVHAAYTIILATSVTWAGAVLPAGIYVCQIVN